ncbi:hypothetical protein [Pseudoxanthobacter sp.]|uniref:F0F1 ATP synthase subunit B family protein n=1 Tax=Pseudoxanthobacter sp. TaxID=1925742 RepID=UPI002FE39458
MQIDWWTLALQAINALVLIWLLGRFLFRPLAAIVAARQAAATADLNAAAAARTAAEAGLAEARAAGAATQAARADVLKQAGAEAERARAAILAAARQEADRLAAAAAADRVAARAGETRRFSAAARALAVDIATRLVARLPAEAQVSGFIDGLAGAVAALPVRSREDLTTALLSTDPAAQPRLVAPRPLTEAERAAVAARLAAVAGAAVQFRSETDPSLLAGLELVTPHIAVRNTLKADLAAISDSLAGQDDGDEAPQAAGAARGAAAEAAGAPSQGGGS